MGLDQFAYWAEKDQKPSKETEFFYWRKHPNLQGWMCNLYGKKSNEKYDEPGGQLNGEYLELTKEDLQDLEVAIVSKNLPHTTGFFFGEPSDDRYYDQDLDFIMKSMELMDEGKRIYYYCWW